MTTHTERLHWTTFNTWAKDRRKAKRVSRRAHRELQQLLDQAPAALAAAREKKTMSDNYWSEEAMEARQEARRALIERCGNPARREEPSRSYTKAPEDDGMWFSRREEQLAEARAEHAARKRRADAERQSSERVFNSLRDTMGADAAEEWMNGGDVA